MPSSRVSSGEHITELGNTSLLSYSFIEFNGRVVETVLDIQPLGEHPCVGIVHSVCLEFGKFPFAI